MNEIGYHGTCSKHRYSIENDGFDPDKCKYRKDHWLGQGVYFFDDYDKALWWASTEAFHNKGYGAVVFEGVIEACDNEVLDLDDKKQVDVFMDASIKLINDIEENCQGEMPIFEDDKFRAVFFDYYKQQNNIAVIIGTFQKEYAGYTKRRSCSDRKKQRMIMNITGIRFLERQICVSKKECIKTSKLVYNEEEEVI